MRVAALYVYPVKACAAVPLESSALGPLGLSDDRRFAFVAEDGRALTQREHPLLATVRPVLDEATLRLDFGGLLERAVGLRDFTEPTAVDVWGERVPGRAMREEVFEYLGVRARLVALEPAVPRSFRDSQPVLVTTGGMLARLNLPGIGMERFRPNIVLEGDADWHALRGEEVELEYAKPCGRCEVTTIDQASGARRGPEPLQTLQERFEGNFGVYCRVARAGRLRRGEMLSAL